MKLQILMDNNTEIDVYYLGEPAVSYWLETEGKAFLFDTGYSDAFLKNAAGMGIDLTKAEAILLSHSHIDHTGGLQPLFALDFTKKPILLAHPDALLPHDWNGMDIGSPLSQAELAEKTVQLFEQDIATEGLMHEYYNPETGMPINNPGFQNWNLLALNMQAWLNKEPVVSEF